MWKSLGFDLEGALLNLEDAQFGFKCVKLPLLDECPIDDLETVQFDVKGAHLRIHPSAVQRGPISSSASLTTTEERRLLSYVSTLT